MFRELLTGWDYAVAIVSQLVLSVLFGLLVLSIVRYRRRRKIDQRWKKVGQRLNSVWPYDGGPIVKAKF